MLMPISGRAVSSARSDAVGSWYPRARPATAPEAGAGGEPPQYDTRTRADIGDLHTIVCLLRQKQPLL